MELMELDKIEHHGAPFPDDENWSTKTANQVTPREEEKGEGARRRCGNSEGVLGRAGEPNDTLEIALF